MYINKRDAFLFLLITGGKVSEESTPDPITTQALIIEVKQLQISQSETIKAQKETTQELEKELRSHQQFKLQLEQNKTLSDSLQRQLEALQVEKATLLSRTSVIRERLLHKSLVHFGIKPFVLVLILRNVLLLNRGKLWTMPSRMVFSKHIMLLPC